MDEEIIRDDSAQVLFRTMEDGNFMDAVGVKLRAAVVELRARAERGSGRASGAMTIKVGLTVDDKGVLETEGEVDVRLPKPKRARNIHWIDADGDITSRRAERQLELRPVAIKAETPTAAPAKEPKAPATKAM